MKKSTGKCVRFRQPIEKNHSETIRILMSLSMLDSLREQIDKFSDWISCIEAIGFTILILLQLMYPLGNHINAEIQNDKFNTEILLKTREYAVCWGGSHAEKHFTREQMNYPRGKIANEVSSPSGYILPAILICTPNENFCISLKTINLNINKARSFYILQW